MVKSTEAVHHTASFHWETQYEYWIITHRLRAGLTDYFFKAHIIYVMAYG